MTKLNFIANHWHALVLQEEHDDYREKWICDELFYRLLISKKSVLLSGLSKMKLAETLKKKIEQNES
jgi:hypothetical protein